MINDINYENAITTDTDQFGSYNIYLGSTGLFLSIYGNIRRMHFMPFDSSDPDSFNFSGKFTNTLYFVAGLEIMLEGFVSGSGIPDKIYWDTHLSMSNLMFNMIKDLPCSDEIYRIIDDSDAEYIHAEINIRKLAEVVQMLTYNYSFNDLADNFNYFKRLKVLKTKELCIP